MGTEGRRAHSILRLSETPPPRLRDIYGEDFYLFLGRGELGLRLVERRLTPDVV